MTSRERQIIIDAINEHRQAAQYHRRHGNIDNGRVVSEALASLRELALRLGVDAHCDNAYDDNQAH